MANFQQLGRLAALEAGHQGVISHSGGPYHTYAVSPDGQRFLVFQLSLTAAPALSFPPDPSTGLTVALNWTAALKK